MQAGCPVCWRSVPKCPPSRFQRQGAAGAAGSSRLTAALPKSLMDPPRPAPRSRVTPSLTKWLGELWCTEGRGRFCLLFSSMYVHDFFLAGLWSTHYTPSAKAVCSLRCHWHPNKMAPGQGNVRAPGPWGSWATLWTTSISPSFPTETIQEFRPDLPTLSPSQEWWSTCFPSPGSQGQRTVTPPEINVLK